MLGGFLIKFRVVGAIRITFQKLSLHHEAGCPKGILFARFTFIFFSLFGLNKTFLPLRIFSDLEEMTSSPFKYVPKSRRKKICGKIRQCNYHTGGDAIAPCRL